MQSRATFVKQSAFAMQIQLCMYAAEQPTVSIVATPGQGESLLWSSIATRACDRVQMPSPRTNPDLRRLIRLDVESFLTVIIGETWHFLPSQS